MFSLDNDPFHIASNEKCRLFSPILIANLQRDPSIRQALDSPLFRQIRQSGLQAGEQHHGGCVLFERQAEVESLLLQSALRPSLQLTDELAGTDKWQAVEEQ